MSQIFASHYLEYYKGGNDSTTEAEAEAMSRKAAVIDSEYTMPRVDVRLAAAAVSRSVRFLKGPNSRDHSSSYSCRPAIQSNILERSLFGRIISLREQAQLLPNSGPALVGCSLSERFGLPLLTRA